MLLKSDLQAVLTIEYTECSMSYRVDDVDKH